ncbi:hypothetical protein GPS50_16760 [Acinetobacter haemolyticus]|uniref:Uncharacterized protein n=1 Tax=Acinetobacter haemolyticus TaxID=29430 RepID=A0A4P7B045_ACIHA|nr:MULTISPECIES: hypothetical protein [Acinetobacter]EEH68344.1 hypothetical protein HMPREF0023_2165 [Acinetobacter sp. ATCC 27244]NAR81288.1 hypothetical protein [Acinetobacter haemolyticus]NAR85882.1 hypothetical protein [Acinetobacter haemolyticus]QBQ14842.1 hypothetical protein AHTJR_00410 [Acinetobacter haemolyticus]QHI24827.1 hypothetical protein Ahae2126ch_00490 [Acinetobacter haemolyticus]
MAFLIEGLNSNRNLSLDMCYPESFRNLDELIIIPEENLLVIKERWNGKSCDTFFNLQTLERTDPFKRYNQENGKAFHNAYYFNYKIHRKMPFSLIIHLV